MRVWQLELLFKDTCFSSSSSPHKKTPSGYCFLTCSFFLEMLTAVHSSSFLLHNKRVPSIHLLWHWQTGVPTDRLKKWIPRSERQAGTDSFRQGHTSTPQVRRWEDTCSTRLRWTNSQRSHRFLASVSQNQSCNVLFDPQNIRSSVSHTARFYFPPSYFVIWTSPTEIYLAISKPSSHTFV